MLTLQTPLAQSRLPTGTSRILKRLHEGLGIETIRDLLWHLPLRYENRGSMLSIAHLMPGVHASVIGTIERMRVTRTMRKKLSLAEGTISDPTGSIQVVWFNQPWMTERLHVGDRVLLTGKVTANAGRRYFANPQYEILERTPQGAVQTNQRKNDLDATLLNAQTSSLIPIYGETEGITSRWINYLIREALKRVGQIPDPLPDIVQKSENLPLLANALSEAHTPTSLAHAEKAKQSLLFRELFVLQCAVTLARARRETHQALAVSIDAPLIQQFLKTLPFRLTESQRIATYEILRDMEKARPMQRLLVGDVGSGKTVVAAIAALNAVKRGKGQAALMAPTEILAQQHFTTLTRTLTPHGVRVGLLTGSESRVTPKRIVSERTIAISKPKLFKEVAEGAVHVLVGTHALITRPKTPPRTRFKPQKPLTFKKLLIAIIDEQHRFGVTQRKHMQEAEHIFAASRKLTPHLLTLTATPIPRTLALTIFGDLDVSLLYELPKGRQPIDVSVLTPGREREAFLRIREEVAKGRQAFIICPLVSRSEKIEAKAAKEEFTKLKQDVFPDLALGLLHGQMKSKEKETVMRDFERGKVAILIATPVVEVGIDVPNATVMVVLGVERFGLAQLYQFRGRVGRGSYLSWCYFIAERASTLTKERLSAVQKAQSGSDIAEADLRLRGPGELLGSQQSGVPDTLMQALGDFKLIGRARSAARSFLGTTPLRNEPALAHAIAEIHAQLHLS